MAKYDEEFKLKVVRSYLNGEGGYKSIAKKFGIPCKKSVKKWVKYYGYFGSKGLSRNKNKQDYSLDFKLSVIQSYLNGGGSQMDIALKFGLPEPTLISSWLSVFNSKGISGLAKQKGRPPLSKKKNENKNIKEFTREELERENELLRAQLAFIKKLQASGINIPERLKK